MLYAKSKYLLFICNPVWIHIWKFLRVLAQKIQNFRRDKVHLDNGKLQKTHYRICFTGVIVMTQNIRKITRKW